ncbi:hypothetical protein HMPREF9134_00567 [Porphyromonas catoniae F0037]|uniref:Uncharacterized protein n=1 Tax=Porphyromonas catoniae F0037 TaxID=1127696 RepID=L1NFM8_9PORP|nr:hypothetical protein HMPREF9134_00567 [Porphyromonas catoniae F0037]
MRLGGASPVRGFSLSTVRGNKSRDRRGAIALSQAHRGVAS